jgi:hypothetical protein
MNKLAYCFQQFWYQITCQIVAFYKWITRPVSKWLEWFDAQYWAKDIHPGWVHLANNSEHKETRMYYREKILAAYKGEE